MKLAKLILHYNTPELTAKLCEMVPDAIVIDNGSTNTFSGANRVIRLPENYGFTKGWNEGIKRVYDEFDAFWLMNSDIKVSKQSIERVESLINEKGIDIFTPSYNCWIKNAQNKGTNGVREVKVIEFTAPIIHKRVFEKIGFLDNRFVRGYGVEFDYCYRARKAGFKIWVDDASQFYHIGQQTISTQTDGIIPYSQAANLELTRGLIAIYGEKWRDIILAGVDMNSDFNLNIAVYTTIFGNYDTLKPVPKQNITATFYCITDNPKLSAPGWKIILVNYPRKDLHPRLRAKYFKMFPYEVPELNKKQITIYVDGSIQITSEKFVQYCVQNLASDMVLFKHPNRDCIYEELKASQSLEKYKTEPINEQIEAYKQLYPRNGGLYACGVLVRKHTEEVKRVMQSWWLENIKWSYQDQLSFPFVCKQHNFTPGTFEENQYNTGYFKVIWHDDGKQPVTNNVNYKVSVLMPVWNTPVHEIKEAVSSILSQTYKAFEFVIVDDGNEKPDIIQYLNSLRQYKNIKVVRPKKHTHLSNALNFGLENCSGDLVIRMDADDIASPHLVKKQIEFFENNKAAVICGVQITAFGSRSFTSRHFPVITKQIARENEKFWFVNHPGVAYKRDVILKLGAYGDVPGPALAEDYALWCKILKAGYEIYNMQESLIKYRMKERLSRRAPNYMEHLQQCKKTLYE